MVHGQADVTFSLCRSSLFWDVTQRWLAVSYRRFGTTYRYHREVWSSPRVYAIRDFLNLGVGKGACTSLPTGTISNTELPSVFVRVVQHSSYFVASFTLFCAEQARTYQSVYCIQRCFVTDVLSVVYGLDSPGFDSQQGEEIVVFSKTCTPPLGPVHPLNPLQKRAWSCPATFSI